ncbi:hypothetical protein CGRA01v4_14871 [Colletotrichum graminicola]|uniref:Uncharacterized protein n=1 Tax=Colletotrichum graminicola (strain M1.001 / M2 / FGSC 10212) TaxID=645133 RepID=E3QFF4_COLGM|nr:uncharacterized protein GLRG_04736 [Colletotrichum graminicola M1.001]EFQ29592.1 hypothetical protein GLRG_04736 [Colletotrichum graminicola M1.001]WDK23579.1 hypothetical protein CGRA01v4_14871 [Colletotrichum graminicola]
MAGDARKKGGAYSDNPKTRRTVEYLQNLPAEKKNEKRKNFLEYRSLRTACITCAKKADYQQSRSRDDKLAMLREACQNAMANRLKKGIDYEGTDIETHVARFHDRAFCGSKKNAGASDVARTPSPASEADGPNPDAEQSANAHNDSQTTGPASTPNTTNIVDSIGHDNSTADDIDEDSQLLEEGHEMILQEISVRAYIQVQTAHKLRLLVEAAGL